MAKSERLDALVRHWTEVILADCGGGPDMSGPPGQDTIALAIQAAFDAGAASERAAAVAFIREVADGAPRDINAVLLDIAGTFEAGYHREDK